eukprot:750196-Hanusia_phi.AAC.8
MGRARGRGTGEGGRREPAGVRIQRKEPEGTREQGGGIASSKDQGSASRRQWDDVYRQHARAAA